MTECVRIRHFHSFEGPLHKPDFEEKAGTFLCFFARKAFGKEVIMKPHNQFTIKVVETAHKILAGIVAVFFFELAIAGYLLLEQSKSHRLAYNAYIGLTPQSTSTTQDEKVSSAKQYTKIEKEEIQGAGNIDEIDRVFGVKLKSTQMNSSSQDPHRFVTPSSNVSIKRQFKERQESKPALQENQAVNPVSSVNLISTDGFTTHIEKVMEKHADHFNSEEENSELSVEWEVENTLESQFKNISNQISDKWKEVDSENIQESQIKNISTQIEPDKTSVFSKEERNTQAPQSVLFPEFRLSDNEKEAIQKLRRLTEDEEIKTE